MCNGDGEVRDKTPRTTEVDSIIPKDVKPFCDQDEKKGGNKAHPYLKFWDIVNFEDGFSFIRTNTKGLTTLHFILLTGQSPKFMCCIVN